MKHKLLNHHTLLALALLPACHTAKHTHRAETTLTHTTAIDTTATKWLGDFAQRDTVGIVMSISRYEVTDESEREPRLKSVTVVDYNKTRTKTVNANADVQSVTTQHQTLESEAETKADTHECSGSDRGETRTLIIILISILFFTLFLILRR